jgi:Predicted Fe-S oxidoreductases
LARPDTSCTRAMGDAEDARAVSIMLTRRCNMTCAHCSVQSGPKIREEPTRDELIATLHSAADAGIQSIQITGGEPMIREDIVFDLLKVARKRGMIATMSSNGSGERNRRPHGEPLRR